MATAWIDPDNDPNQYNSDVHWRLYDHPDHGVVAVCVQGFDYPDYHCESFLNYEAYETEDEALADLQDLYDHTTALAARIEATGRVS